MTPAEQELERRRWDDRDDLVQQRRDAGRWRPEWSAMLVVFAVAAGAVGYCVWLAIASVVS